MHPIEAVELRGELVTIEPLAAEHAEGILAAADSDEVFAWLPYSRPADLPAAQAWIADALADRDANRRFPFAVREAESGTVIGSTSYWDFDPANAHLEIGSTWFRRSSWRTGVNVETKLLLMRHAFEGLHLERVSFRTDIRNERSQRAIERLGAVQEGVHRHEMRRRDGSWRDSVHYSILRSEWHGNLPSVQDRKAETPVASTHFQQGGRKMSGQPSHYEIAVPDVERARAFYGELFGWDFDSTDHGAQVGTEPVPGGIHPEAGPGLQLFFSVSNIEEAANRIVELGGEVHAGSSEGPGGRYLHSCRDDQGVPFGLHEPAKTK